MHESICKHQLEGEPRSVAVITFLMRGQIYEMAQVVLGTYYICVFELETLQKYSLWPTLAVRI